MCLLVTEDQLRCFMRHNQHQKNTSKSLYVALKSWDMLNHIDSKVIRLHYFEFRFSIYEKVWPL